jgi:flavodoxin
MKSLLVLCSYHHKNTEKIANAIGQVLGAEVKTPQQIDPEELKNCDLIGFGSGIYDGKHHKALLNLADELPPVSSGRAFIFSTCGVPAIGFSEQFMLGNHSTLREKLQFKGYVIADEFGCVGWNTNSFLRAFGGINKGRPNAKDLNRAREFAQNLKLSATRGDP